MFTCFRADSVAVMIFGAVMIFEVSGGRVRGRPRLGWMDSVKVALGNREMRVEAARQYAEDRKACRALDVTE